MYIVIKDVFVNLNSSLFIYTLKVSNDIDSITVVSNGTTQTFTGKINDEIIINIPITEDSVINSTFKYGDVTIGNFINKVEVNNVLNTNISSVGIDEIIDITPTLELTTITLNPIYADEEMEYTRGLNDGLILGQMI